MPPESEEELRPSTLVNNMTTTTPTATSRSSSSRKRCSLEQQLLLDLADKLDQAYVCGGAVDCVKTTANKNHRDDGDDNNDNDDNNAVADLSTPLRNLAARIEAFFAKAAGAVGGVTDHHEKEDGDGGPPPTAAAAASTASRSSPVVDACSLWIHSRMFRVFQRTSLLVEESLRKQKRGEQTSTFERIVQELRSTFAIYRVGIYLDRMEAAMEARDDLDPLLADILQWTEAHGIPVKDDNSRLCVSPWTGSLGFTLRFGTPTQCAIPAADGEKTTTSSSSTSLPLTVQVDPVVEFSASELLQKKGLPVLEPYRPCITKIEKCLHEPYPYSQGSGVIGLATIKIRLLPLDGVDSNGFRVWLHESEVRRKLVVQEARVLQVNAFPPRPKLPVDSYTSCIYGDTAITVTHVMKTFTTERPGEAPLLHIELSLAPVLFP